MAKSNVVQMRRPPTPNNPAFRTDGWFNTLTALNVPGKDKRRAADFYSKRITEFEAEDLWRGDDIMARIIETLPRVMLRHGFDVSVGDATPTPDKPKLETEPNDEYTRLDRLAPVDFSQNMAKKLLDLKTASTFIRALDYARAFGGSAVLIGSDEAGKQFKDLKRYQDPLDPRRLKDIRWLTVLRPHECWPVQWYRDVLTPHYGTPKVYRVVRDVMGGAAAHAPFLVHESRLVRFYGITTSVRQMAMNNGWGDSIMIRLLEIVADFQMSFQALAYLISDFAQAVQKMKGLAELVAAGEHEQVAKRAELIAMSRSVARTVLIDSEEEFERKATPMSGLPESMTQLCNRVAAAALMPVTLLMGQAPAGLNATGDSDLRWFYDSAANDREMSVRPGLEYLVRLLMLCSEGPTGGIEPATWKLNWHPLWQPTEKELAETRKTIAETDALYVQNQVLTPEEVAESRFGGPDWSMETSIDKKTRKKMATAHKAMVDDQVQQGQIPTPSARQAAGQQHAIALATALPDKGDDEADDKGDDKKE